MEGILLNKMKKTPYIVLVVLVTILILFNLFIFKTSDSINHAIAFRHSTNPGYGRGCYEKNDGPEEHNGIDQHNDLQAAFEPEHNNMLLINNQYVDRHIENYIDINNQAQINQTLTISDNTPLDMLTASMIVYYSKKLEVPIPLVMAVIDLESKFKQYAVGGAEDRGYCQIIPGTEKWLADTYGHLLEIEYDPERIFEPEYNLGLGMLYLYHLKKAHNSNYHRILSEYNRGPYNLKKYYDKHKTYETTYSKVVLEKKTKYKHLLAAR